MQFFYQQNSTQTWTAPQRVPAASLLASSDREMAWKIIANKQYTKLFTYRII